MVVQVCCTVVQDRCDGGKRDIVVRLPGVWLQEEVKENKENR